MAHLSWAVLGAADSLHCKEQLACDVDGLQDDEDMGCLTAESNLSFMSEDSFSSSGSCAPHVAGLSSSKAAHQQQHKAAASPYDVDALLAEQEEATPHPSGYLHTTQAATGVTAVHRATVVDNMVSAAARLALTNDSLFTAVAVLDRYLALKPTPLPLLQPTAIACLWVAAKYEQLVVPPVAQFALLVQGTDAGLSGGGSSALGRQLLVELEADVLAVLEFRLAAIVTVKSFKAALMSRLQGSKAAAGLCRRQLDQLYCMASYLTEVSMLEYRLLCCPPSQVAAAAFVYALMLLGLPYADAVRLTGYTQEGLQALLEMFCALHTTLSAALQLRRPYNVTVKYCSPAVRGVAHIPPELRMEQRAW